MTIYLTSCTAPKVSLLGTCYHFIISSWTWEMLKRFKKSKRRNVWVHDISKRSYQIASRNKLQEFNQPETKVVIHHTFFLEKTVVHPFPERDHFSGGPEPFWLRIQPWTTGNDLTPGTPVVKPPFIFNKPFWVFWWFVYASQLMKTFFGQGSVLLLKPKLLVPLADAPLVLEITDLFQCFPRPCRQTCRPKLSSKNCANGQMIHNDFWRILLVQEHLDGSQKHQDSDPGK